MKCWIYCGFSYSQKTKLASLMQTQMSDILWREPTCCSMIYLATKQSKKKGKLFGCRIDSWLECTSQPKSRTELIMLSQVHLSPREHHVPHSVSHWLLVFSIVTQGTFCPILQCQQGWNFKIYFQWLRIRLIRTHKICFFDHIWRGGEN